MISDKYTINSGGNIISSAVLINKVLNNFLFKTIFFFVWVFGFFSIGLLIGRALIAIDLPEQVFGLSYICFSIFLIYLSLRAFDFNKLQHPRVCNLKDIKAQENANLFSVFSYELAKASYKLFHNQKDATAKELAICLLGSSDMTFVLVRIGIGKEAILKELESYNSTVSAKEIVARSLDYALAESHHQIEAGDVFAALCEEDKFFQDLLVNLKLEVKDIVNIVYWQTLLIREYKKESKIFTPDRLRLNGGIGRDWAFGFTPFLNQFSSDITSSIKANGLGLELIGHEREIGQIKEVLLQNTGGNAIVVGEPGVGKRTTILGFAQKVAEGKTDSVLDFQHIIKLDADRIISNNPAEISERLSGIFNEASYAGNILIFIENIDNLLASGDAGKIDATEILLPFLESSEMHVIGTCDISSYNKYISSNSSLSQRFTRVSIEEPSKEEMVRILEDTVPLIEHNSKSVISYEAIKETIRVADKYILNLPNPEKSINLLDSAAVKAAAKRGKTIILPKDILEYASEKFEVPSMEVDNKEKEMLLSLEDQMHKRVIGQSEAIKAISNAMRRARVGITDSKKPIGSFLFLGPTGVGKTETAKALAESYFGNSENMIRFDMSEYQNQEDIYRLIGSNIGEENSQGVLTTAIREHPFSLVLFDEIEKANPNILDLFLQILDEGILTDGQGRKVSFSNSIIIATSNAGANLIRESIKDGSDYELTKKSLLDFLQKENIYRPEFLNRFTSIVAFSPLSKEEISKVAVLMIDNLSKDISKNKGINLSVDPEAVKRLAELGYDPQMGARPMARVVQEKLEDLLAKKILSGELNKGDSYLVGLSDII